MKNSNDIIWDRTSDLLICSAVPNHCATAVPILTYYLLLFINSLINIPYRHTGIKSCTHLWFYLITDLLVWDILSACYRVLPCYLFSLQKDNLYAFGLVLNFLNC
jgi:hypothetical protein